MTVYVIAQVEITDPETYQKYLDGFAPIFQRHGGKVLGRSVKTEVIEGQWAYPRTILMSFPTAADAHRWHDDPDYQAIAAHRLKASKANLVIVDGV